LHELALFAGAGGGILGSKLLGWDTRCAVEINPYCQQVLLARQRDGILPRFPIWDDIETFDGRPWRGSIDIVTGGFPCQDISCAGKGMGITGKSSGLFFEMLRIIKEVQPTFVLAENSPHLRTKGLGTVVEGLTSLGYVGCHGVLGAWHVGAPHERNRMWIAATHPDRHKLWEQSRRGSGENREKETKSDNDIENLWKKEVANNTTPRCLAAWGIRDRFELEKPLFKRHVKMADQRAHKTTYWEAEPNVGRVVPGMASGLDRLKALGNGQVPLVAATAWTILSESLKNFTEIT